jgi:tetratricopeptide (TPR) repeat protein
VSQGQVDSGLRVAADALAARSNDPDAREHLASIFADLGDVDRLRPLVADMERDAPGREGTLYYAASAEFLQGNFARAAELAEQALRIDPNHARARNLLGAAYASLGQRDRARRAFQASLRANPRDPATYANLGVFELQAANPQEALDYFAEALSLDPDSPTALAGLNDALAAIKARP